uniref:Uncharacterized protein n=1 Tax=Meloidogyne enterolobii TaxID=390850 RepID=A0A6V7VSB6_MELEN|nr:unnamed protein product [Meloidogyne enterolobii]
MVYDSFYLEVKVKNCRASSIFNQLLVTSTFLHSQSTNSKISKIKTNKINLIKTSSEFKQNMLKN